MQGGARVSDLVFTASLLCSPFPGVEGQELPFGQVSCVSEKGLPPPLQTLEGQVGAPGGAGGAYPEGRPSFHPVCGQLATLLLLSPLSPHGVPHTLVPTSALCSLFGAKKGTLGV